MTAPPPPCPDPPAGDGAGGAAAAPDRGAGHPLVAGGAADDGRVGDGAGDAAAGPVPDADHLAVGGGTSDDRRLAATDLAEVVGAFGHLLHAAGVPVTPERSGRFAREITLS